MTPAEFRAATDVSRETLRRLEIYAGLLEKWTTTINLVSRSTVGDLWRRHMLDSAQLFSLIPPDSRNLVDLGSGAGFPGMVLAIMGVRGVHLVESDKRKCAFLGEVARRTGTTVTIHPVRIDQTPEIEADLITARALSKLPELLDLAENFTSKHSILLFLKGRGVDEELTRARERWNMRARQIPSQTDSDGIILGLEAISRVVRAT